MTFPDVVRTTVAAGAVAGLIALAPPAAAQGNDALRVLEGKHVTVKIDMPGTADGVDVQADANQPIDYREYGDRLKQYGTSIRSGESAIVTLIKLKKDLIEVQLNGGGFGTFFDDTSSSVNLRRIEKSEREKDLEKRIKAESDSRRKRQLEDELDDVRDRRERENRRLDVERVRAEERKKERIAAARLTGGSRFNVRYARAVPEGIRPEELIALLTEYVDFSGTPSAAQDTRTGTGAGDAGPQKGMTRAEAERAFGGPLDVSSRREGTLVVTTMTFSSAGRRITAEFVEDVLIRYTMSSR
jgi:hypothetical protein